MIRAVGVAALAAALLAPGGASAAPRGRMPVKSLVEIRRERVVQQGWDLSCGAAALSTLLTYEHADPVTEAEVVRMLLEGTDPERVRKRGGFSLLDLKRVAVARGYRVLGYRKLALKTLVPLAPAIVPTRVRGQPHFVIFRGVVQGRAVLGDPAFGNRTVPVAWFEGAWAPRIAVVVKRPGEAGEARQPPRPVVPTPQAIRGAMGGMR